MNGEHIETIIYDEATKLPKKTFKERFKKKWLMEDEKCHECGQVTKQVRGLTKQNVKRLFTFKWNTTEFLIMFLLLMFFVMSLLYQGEVGTTRAWLLPMMSGDKDHCLQVCDQKCFKMEEDRIKANLTWNGSQLVKIDKINTINQNERNLPTLMNDTALAVA